ncbi:class F sortase [Spirillospora sp. CA-294931]|uniref:class F sortase n=1 Tax=Spirillospora sp. CA-294931 TaxID=3240042 RepID=UPI003D8D3378
MRAATVAVAALLSLTACGGRATGEPPMSTPGEARWAQVRFAAPLPRAEPALIQIPKLKVSAPVTRLGLKPDGTIEEPPLSRPNLAGWWEEGPTPGEGGPSVIIGHLDADHRPAVFYGLKSLVRGDRILVTRQDGRTATFAVERIERVPKTSFPAEKIYAEDIDHAALRLVTCGGAVDPATGRYRDNVIAYTRLVQP